jgi:hypothetical protein
MENSSKLNKIFYLIFTLTVLKQQEAYFCLKIKNSVVEWLHFNPLPVMQSDHKGKPNFVLFQNRTLSF